MEPKYTVESCMTQEEYVKFNEAVIRSSGMNRIMIPVCTGIIIVLGIYRMVQGRIGIGIYLIALAILFNVFLGFSTRRRAIRTWQATKELQNRKVRYYFYDDHMESESLGNGAGAGTSEAAGSGTGSRSAVRYDSLHRVLETPTNFYILTSAGQGIAIRKEDCEPGLIELLQGIKK